MYHEEWRMNQLKPENFVAFLGFWQSRFYDDGRKFHCNIYPEDLETGKEDIWKNKTIVF